MISNWPISSLEQINKLKTSYFARTIAITGGASFIGSHLVEALLYLGSKVRVFDDFSSGKPENLKPHENLTLHQIDLYNTAEKMDLEGAEAIFHLAAIHGGRGFIEKNSTSLLRNFTIDSNTYLQAVDAGIETIVFASSACAYSTDQQISSEDRKYLSESEPGHMDSGPKPDGMYGWTKLIGEYQLEKFAQEKSIIARGARIFTAYGDRENESHAAIALMAKSLLKMDPFPVWGDGNQTRNFTYVTDTVTGLLCLGTDTEPGFEVCNVGTNHHVTVNEFLKEIFDQLEWQPKSMNYQLDKPAGVASRSSNNEKILMKYNWQPNVSLSEGIRRTLDWYKVQPSRPLTLEDLEQKLMSR